MRGISPTGVHLLSRSGDERSLLRTLGSVNWGPLMAALALALVGATTIHSATSELTLDYLPRQGLWIGLGLVVFTVGVSLDYHLLHRISTPIFLVGLLLLVLVLLVGREAGGAQSWLGIGSLGLQPSEFAKVATALVLSRYLGETHGRLLERGQIARASLIVALPVGLIVMEPDLGGASTFLFMFACLILVAGIRWRTLVNASVIVLLLGAGTWNFGMRDYQRQRILSFLAPEQDPLGAGYQVRQSKIAVGSGELMGKGFMQGTQSQLRFLPARHTDFILAVLAEEWGFLGVVSVLGLYVFYLFSGVRIAGRARDRKGVLLVVGLLSLLTVHILYNSAMVIGFLPVTGIPLPFLSYGGSFTLFSFFATGLIIGVDFRRYVNR